MDKVLLNCVDCIVELMEARRDTSQSQRIVEYTGHISVAARVVVKIEKEDIRLSSEEQHELHKLTFRCCG